MLANVKSCAVIDLYGVVVEVEVDTRSGLSKIVIVELQDAAMKDMWEGGFHHHLNIEMAFERL